LFNLSNDVHEASPLITAFELTHNQARRIWCGSSCPVSQRNVVDRQRWVRSWSHWVT